MRFRGLLLALPMLALPGCGARASAGGGPLPIETLVGSYELASIGGRPVPVREFQAVYHGGRITLHAGGRYVSEFDVESCTTDGACTRETTAAEGSWRVLEDGTLSFESPGEAAEPSEEEHHEPPPRIEADGRELRYYTRSLSVPIFRYTRREP